ncbi:MAG: hypothetical protein ACI4XJ_10830 [Eubacteriales bacterium]
MKHIRLIVILSLVVLVFSSCGDTADMAENQSSTRFIYRMANGEALDWDACAGMPVKVNLTTGKTTPVCIDPLCMHDTDECPFYNCFGCAADGTVLFFRRGLLTRNEKGFEGMETLCAYNEAMGDFKVLREYADSIICAGVKDNVLYYYTAEFQSENGELSCVYSLHCADGNSGKITDLPTERVYGQRAGIRTAAIIRILSPSTAEKFTGLNTTGTILPCIIRPIMPIRINNRCLRLNTRVSCFTVAGRII